MSYGKIIAADMQLLDSPVEFFDSDGSESGFGLQAFFKNIQDGTAITFYCAKQFQNDDADDSYQVIVSSQIVFDTANGRNDTIVDGVISLAELLPIIKVADGRKMKCFFVRDSSYIDASTGLPIDLSASSQAFDFYFEVLQC